MTTLKGQSCPDADVSSKNLPVFTLKKCTRNKIKGHGSPVYCPGLKTLIAPGQKKNQYKHRQFHYE